MGIVSLKYHQYIGCTGNMASRLASEGRQGVIGD